MKNTKMSKHALLSSIIAVLLSITMFIGTTFAWFTDSVTSGVNKIVAGNLDVEVKYSKNGRDWDDLDGSRTLFSNNLWEPGHTEVVYLKVENVGTLALNYKVLVTPVSENGGVNVEGRSFKLSDHLVFGTTTPGTTSTTYTTRDEARAAVGSTRGLTDVNSLTKTGTMAGKTSTATVEQYMALVVYMPEDVGNEANYKTGTTAPTIELGIKVVATQKTAENDSFGDDYDDDAVNTPFYTVGSYYDYFPQVSASASVVENGNTVITAEGKLNSSDTGTTTLAKVTVPAAAVAENATELSVTVVPQDITADISGTALLTEINDSNRETSNFDVKVSGIKSDNAAPITVEVFVGKGLANVKVYHNGTLIASTSYDATTGIVTFTTTRFSDFTVAYDVAAVAIGDKTYGSLKGAVDIAKNGDAIKLLNDIRVEEGAIKVEKDLTLDLAGNTLTIANTNDDGLVVTNGATLNLTNSLASKGKYIFDCTSSRADSIYVYNTEEGKTSTLNIKNPVVLEINAATNSAIHAYGASGNAVVNIEDGTEIKVTGSNNHTSAVIIDQNATFNMMGGIFDLNVDFETYTDNNDVVGVLLWGQNGNQRNCTFNLSGGTFKVGGKNAFAQGIQIGMKDGYSDTVTVNITGGSIEINATEGGNGYAFTAYSRNYGKFTMSGGSVSGDLKAITTTANGENADLTVTGGTFSSDPTDYVDTVKYTVTQNENGTWTVTAK